MTTIKEHFETFEKGVIPKDAPDIQRREMRLAFYAGCFAMMNETSAISDLSESEAIMNYHAVNDMVSDTPYGAARPAHWLDVTR